MYERRVDQVLAEKPGLEFIGAQHVADGQIVGAIVSQLGGAGCQGAAMADDDLVRVEQAGNLYWYFFPAPWGTLDASGFGYVGSHGNRDAAEKLYSFGDGVDDF